jgi:GxxExxY protein
MDTDEHRFGEREERIGFRLDGQLMETGRLNSISERVIGCAFRVHNVLGYGFLEKVYENALAHEIRKAGLACEQQRRILVEYDSVVVGDYVVDLIVEDALLIEVKSARAIDEAHVAQCLNYLTATELPLGLVLNFGKKVEVKRLASARMKR